MRNASIYHYGCCEILMKVKVDTIYAIFYVISQYPCSWKMSLKFDNGERESIIDFNVHDVSDANNNEITHVVKVSVYIIERWKLTIFHFQKEFLQNHNSSNYFSKDIDTNYEIHNNANEGSYSSENQLNEDPNISNSKKSSIKVCL